MARFPHTAAKPGAWGRAPGLPACTAPAPVSIRRCRRRSAPGPTATLPGASRCGFYRYRLKQQRLPQRRSQRPRERPAPGGTHHGFRPTGPPMGPLPLKPPKIFSSSRLAIRRLMVAPPRAPGAFRRPRWRPGVPGRRSEAPSIPPPQDARAVHPRPERAVPSSGATPAVPSGHLRVQCLPSPRPPNDAHLLGKGSRGRGMGGGRHVALSVHRSQQLCAKGGGGQSPPAQATGPGAR